MISLQQTSSLLWQLWYSWPIYRWFMMIYQRVNFFLWVLKSQQPLTLCMESLHAIPRMTIFRLGRGWPEWPGWALNVSEVIGVPNNSCFFWWKILLKIGWFGGTPCLWTPPYMFLCVLCVSWLIWWLASHELWHNTKDQHKHRQHQYLYLAFGNQNHVEIRDGTTLDIKSIAITAAASKIIDHFSKEMHRDV